MLHRKALIIMAICAMATGAPAQGRILLHGKPFFAVGVYDYPEGKVDRDVIDELARCGMNVIFVRPNTPSDVLDHMAARGVYAVVPTGETMLLHGEMASAKRSDLAKWTAALKNHPALLAWEGPDEPIWNWKNRWRQAGDPATWELPEDAQRTVWEFLNALRDGYAEIKRLDPEHQVWLNFAPRGRIAELQWFAGKGRQKVGDRVFADGRAAADVFGTDIYPVPGGNGNNGEIEGKLNASIACVGDFTDKLSAVAGGAPYYMVLHGCAILDWDKSSKALRRPTFEESRFMAYQAIVHGAQGILWWGSHYVEPDSLMWSELKRVAKELSLLRPAFEQGKPFEVKTSRRAVRARGWELDGKRYVIAVNETDQPVDAAVQLGSRAAARMVTAAFERRKVVAAEGSVTDRFGPYQVHVYTDDANGAFESGRKVWCPYGLPLNSEQLKGKSPDEIAEYLAKLGVDAVGGVPKDNALIRALHARGIKAYTEMGIFSGKGHWKDHPESRPVNSGGEPFDLKDQTYGGVCPSQEWLRKSILDEVRSRFINYEFDGLWLDFIRYPGKWEVPNPALEHTCFCDRCLAKFQKEAKIRIPSDLKTAKEKASWILENHEQKWTDWKCENIADFVAQIASTVRGHNPTAILGIFNVPWTTDDFDGAVLKILGQDVKRLAKHVDVFSPMVYHGLCGRDIPWIAGITDWTARRTGKDVWPIVQTIDEPAKMSPEDCARTVQAGLNAHGSSGLMVFTFDASLKDGKIEAIAGVMPAR